MGTHQSGKCCQLFVYIFEKVWFGSLENFFLSLEMYIFIYRCFFSLRECKKWPVILFAGTRIRDWVWGPTISARSTCTLSFLWPGVRHYQDVPMASLAWRPRWSLCAKRRGDHVEKSRKIFYKNVSSHCAKCPNFAKNKHLKIPSYFCYHFCFKAWFNPFYCIFSESVLTWKIVKTFEISPHFCT